MYVMEIIESSRQSVGGEALCQLRRANMHLLTTLPHFELGCATSIYIKNGFTPFGVQKFLNLVWGTKTFVFEPHLEYKNTEMTKFL